MPEYEKIANRLIISLCDIIDSAKAAIQAAEESIISDESNRPNLQSSQTERA